MQNKNLNSSKLGSEMQVIGIAVALALQGSREDVPKEFTALKLNVLKNQRKSN